MWRTRLWGWQAETSAEGNTSEISSKERALNNDLPNMISKSARDCDGWSAIDTGIRELLELQDRLRPAQESDGCSDRIQSECDKRQRILESF